MATLNDFERETRQLRWPALGASVALSFFGYAAFIALALLHQRWSALAAPIPLWLGSQFLLIAVRVAAGGSSYLSLGARPWAADLCAFLSALLVGVWIGGDGISPWALLTLPLYAAVESPLRRRLFPSPDASYRPIPLWQWIASVVLGQIAGYLIAILARTG